MVDTLVSGASASRHVGSSPILGTKKSSFLATLFFVPLGNHIYNPSKPPFGKGGFGVGLFFDEDSFCESILAALFLCPWATISHASNIKRLFVF